MSKDIKDKYYLFYKSLKIHNKNVNMIHQPYLVNVEYYYHQYENAREMINKTTRLTCGITYDSVIEVPSEARISHLKSIIENRKFDEKKIKKLFKLYQKKNYRMFNLLFIVLTNKSFIELLNYAEENRIQILFE